MTRNTRNISFAKSFKEKDMDRVRKENRITIYEQKEIINKK